MSSAVLLVFFRKLWACRVIVSFNVIGVLCIRPPGVGSKTRGGAHAFTLTPCYVLNEWHLSLIPSTSYLPTGVVSVPHRGSVGGAGHGTESGGAPGQEAR